MSEYLNAQDLLFMTKEEEEAIFYSATPKERSLLNCIDLGSLVLRPDLDAYDASSYNPDIGSGIYALFNSDEMLLYIGQSTDVNSRIKQHYLNSRWRKGPRFASWTSLPVHPQMLNGVEYAHIWALEPPNNSLFRPITKHHQRLVDQVRKAWND